MLLHRRPRRGLLQQRTEPAVTATAAARGRTAAPTAATRIRACRMASSVRGERTGVGDRDEHTWAHQRVMRSVLRTTSGARVAVIASLVLELASAWVAAPPPSGPYRVGSPSRRTVAGRPAGAVRHAGRGLHRVPHVDRGRSGTGDHRTGRTVLRVKPIGAKAAARAVGSGLLPGSVSYFPDGRVESPISAPTYRRVRYIDVYSGVDLVYYSRARRLEYDS